MPLWGKKKAGPVPLISDSDSSDTSSSSSPASCNEFDKGSRVSSVASRCTAVSNATGTAEALARIGRSASFAGSQSGGMLPRSTGTSTSMLAGYRVSSSFASARTGTRLACTYSSPGFSDNSPRELPVLAASATMHSPSNTFQQYMAQAVGERQPTMNILVIGGPQVGKSSFINAYRAAITKHRKWPTAPVGLCGILGTISVVPYPNHPSDPTWLCIDTPGRFYDAEDEVLLEKLLDGMPWETPLVGRKAPSLQEIENVTPIAANKAHQCVIVIPATDIIEDAGWSNLLLWRARFVPASDAEGVVRYMTVLVSSIRAFMNDTVPFVVISNMDKVGGAGHHLARHAIRDVLSQCVPTNHIYFCSLLEHVSSLEGVGRYTAVDDDTRESLVKLHEDICFDVNWKKRVGSM